MILEIQTVRHLRGDRWTTAPLAEFGSIRQLIVAVEV